ncbi:MAG TPA: hypothetical protein VGE02_16135 [Gemmatimonadales bacterium]
MANRKANKDKPNRGEPDNYDRDLVRDNRRQVEGIAEVEPRGGAEPDISEAQRQLRAGMGTGNLQKDRKGQAQSPVEMNLNQPPKKKEGHE